MRSVAINGLKTGPGGRGCPQTPAAHRPSARHATRAPLASPAKPTKRALSTLHVPCSLMTRFARQKHPPSPNYPTNEPPLIQEIKYLQKETRVTSQKLKPSLSGGLCGCDFTSTKRRKRRKNRKRNKFTKSHKTLLNY